SAWNTGGLNNPATNSVGQSNTISVVNGGQWQAAGLVYLPGSYNTLLVNSGGLVELGGGLQLNGTADTVTNAGGILQFTSATPPLTISGTGAGVTLVSGTLAYRGVTNVDLNANAGGAGTVGAFTWAGVNTLRLNASTSTTVSAYTFANNLGAKNYAGLELVGGTNRLGNAIILDGSHGGTLLLSNTTAVIAGGVTLVGPVPVTSLATSTLAGMLSGGTSGALVKLGAGTLTLAAANTYAGATTVSNGTLELVTVASLGTNTLDISTAGAAQVKLSYAGIATNGGLTFDGVTQAGGTWGGTGSGAAHVDPVHFAAGPGKLFVLSAPPPVASFSAAPTNGVIPLAVTFTDTSTGAITNRWWDFGDGVTTNITATNVVHTYVFAGSATVTLIVSGPGGAGTNTQTTLIVIALAPPAPPVLLPDNGFSVDVGTGAATLTFTATNGYQYRITYKDNLLSTNAWQPVPPPADGWHTATNNEPMTISDPGATNSPHRFYRIEAR
ncbi:MAG: PKD domain-containing protein, partial [Kiritimatiellaeota bacterium]|nr:PKD domain-containing protein [Kiritimatiellota bacterium]